MFEANINMGVLGWQHEKYQVDTALREGVQYTARMFNLPKSVDTANFLWLQSPIAY